MSVSLLFVTVALYGGVAVDMMRNGFGWMGGAFFCYAAANVCFAMATLSGGAK